MITTPEPREMMLLSPRAAAPFLFKDPMDVTINEVHTLAVYDDIFRELTFEFADGSYR